MAFQVDIASIRLRTEPSSVSGQKLVVSIRLADGREIDVINEFGALPDIVIDHTVTKNGVAEAIQQAS